ncbi:MAG: hypothetical protein WAN14_21505, partial [Candidatus Acidiferrales bacterium]
TESHPQHQNQIPCAGRSSLEKTLEADISTWHKTGHFYFALTPRWTTTNATAILEPPQGNSLT